MDLSSTVRRQYENKIRIFRDMNRVEENDLFSGFRCVKIAIIFTWNSPEK